MAFSPLGDLVATGHTNGLARMWSVKTGESVGAAMWHRGWVTSVEFSPEGQHLLTASNEGAVELWTVPDGRRVHTFGRNRGWIWARFSPDAHQVLVWGASNEVQIYDTQTGNLASVPLRHQANRIETAQFRADGRQILTQAPEDPVLLVWSPQPTPDSKVLYCGSTQSIAGSRDGRLIALASALGGDETGAEIRVYQVQDGVELDLDMRHPGGVNAMSFGRDADVLYSAGSAGKVRVWNLSDGTGTELPVTHTNRINRMAIHPRRNLLATASYDQTARLWDATSGEPLSSPLPHEMAISAVLFAPSTPELITVSEKGRVRVYDIDTSRMIREINPPWIRHITHAALSPDGSLLATASRDRTVRFMDVPSGVFTTSILNHESSVDDVKFSPDGQWAMTTCNNSAQLWSVATGEKIGPTFTHSMRLQHIVVSPDFKWFACASNPYSRVFELWNRDQGSLPNARLWIEVITHLEMEGEGTLRWLDNQAWNQKKDALEQGRERSDSKF